MQGSLEPGQGVGVSFRDHLDSSVGQIPDVTPQALAEGDILHEKPEPHALHSPADQVSARRYHARPADYIEAPPLDVVPPGPCTQPPRA